MNLDQLTDAVWQRLQKEKPRALLLGTAPEGLQKYNYVNQKPFEAIVIGTLTPGELLQMPTDPVCTALLEELPVYLCTQPWLRGKTAPELRRELQAAQQRLLRLGAKPLGDHKKLISAQEARRMIRAGEQPPAGSRLTPLARDILEGKEV